MAKNITIAGASYTGVPAVNLQQTGGGTAKFVDTSGDTVIPEALLSGYTAHGADGEPITGTMQPNSGITPSGTISITTNGTHDVTNYAEANVNVPSSGGGGLPDTITAGDTPVLYNSASYHATGTSLTSSGLSITVPKAGSYRFKWVVSGGSGESTYTVKSRLYKNNTAVGTQRTSATTTAYSEDITCNAGDTVTLYLAGFNFWGEIYGGGGGLCACIDWDIGL